MSIINYYVIDTETNGFNVDWHEIIEISVIRCSDRKQLSKVIKPEYPWRSNAESLKVTNRTEADLSQGFPAKEVMTLVDNFLLEDGKTPEYRCIIGHNVSFDRRFLQHLWKKYNKTFPAYLWLDTKSMTKKYANLNLGIAKPSLTLQNCIELLGLKWRGTAHSAISDTQNTYILHDYLVKHGMENVSYIKRIEPKDNDKDEEK